MIDTFPWEAVAAQVGTPPLIAAGVVLEREGEDRPGPVRGEAR